MAHEPVVCDSAKELMVSQQEQSSRIGNSSSDQKAAVVQSKEARFAAPDPSLVDGLAEFEFCPLTCYDVGARGQLQPHWHAIALSKAVGISFILFEPHAGAAAYLRSLYEQYGSIYVAEVGLHHREGPYRLNVTRHATCSSIREPNTRFLRNYNVAPIFDIMHTVDISCSRMDSFVRDNRLAHPDFCKIDVQGLEYEVLEGMGDLLDTCLMLELEAHFYPVYKDQRLLGDIVQLLGMHGFTLRELRPQRTFDTDYVEVNALFAKAVRELRSPLASDKLAYLARVLRIPNYPHGAKIRERLEESLKSREANRAVGQKREQ